MLLKFYNYAQGNRKKGSKATRGASKEKRKLATSD